MNDEEDLLNIPLKKPLFKKKKKVRGSRSARKQSPEVDDDFGDLSVSNGNITITSRKTKPRQTFVRNTEKSTTNVSKWVSGHFKEIEDTAVLGKFTEGDTITGADLEDSEPEPEPNESKRYVPKLDKRLEQKLSKKDQIEQLVHEYENENDDYDEDIPNNYATIEPQPANDLEINIDDEMVEDEETEAVFVNHQETKSVFVDEDKYDPQIGDSDEDIPSGTVRVIEPLDASQELAKLEKMLQDLQLRKRTAEVQKSLNDKTLVEIDEKRKSLDRVLDSV
ncbi:hypothetical protein PSN45_004800 [Yamadazyma tenuis]|uniref:uncharacterized protein n=1 Tax=Candida tenuis TaxID=2315449 RepID=UPI0027A6E403|nr:hypothetical protein PSN45_004800 [Yamadazyma tenuis]